MEKLNRSVLKELTAIQKAPAITIYMPTHTSASPPHMTENQIRMKNLFTQAANLAEDKYHATRLAQQLTAKIDELKDRLDFWENQTPGLLICATPENIRLFHLPIDTEEYVAADKTFHLAPVIGLINDQREFYVLALAQQNPVLYKGSLYELQPSGLELPSNMNDALNIDENNQKSENQGTANGPSMNQSWFNGRGGSRNPEEEDRMKFWRLIDHHICQQADRNLPMILAGVEAETVEYRRFSKYPQILNAIITGNHVNDRQLEELFNQAKSIIYKEIVAPEHRSAVEEYQRLSGVNPAKVAVDSNMITEAAKAGRIDKLLTGLIRRTADTVRDNIEAVQRITFPGSSEERQSLNDVALTVWQSNGKIVNLEQNEMPLPALMLARLRY